MRDDLYSETSIRTRSERPQCLMEGGEASPRCSCGFLFPGFTPTYVVYAAHSPLAYIRVLDN